ncbi:MAG: peptidoglycan-binding protein [Pseudolabrys sp.]
MRCTALLAMLALLIGAAPARAGDSAGVLDLFKSQPNAKPAKKHLRHRAVTAKPAETKPAETKPAPSKPTRTSGRSPANGKPGMVKNAIESRQRAAEKTAPAKAEPVKNEPLKSAPTKPETTKSETTKPQTAKSEPAKAGVFPGIPRGERLKIQAALLWAGDYTGANGGEDPMLTAIKSFQKRNKAKVTGALTLEERAALIAAAKTHEDDFGWSVVVDPATGIRIGLPTKLVPNARDAARGTRWSSAHGEVQVETFRIKDDKLKLAALFEREKKEPASRRVSTSVLHDDNFFISGMQGLKDFSVRAKLRDGEIRGFTMLYDQAMEGIVAPVMVAMASAFSPFPEHSAPFAALARSVDYGNGLVVSAQGDIVTDVKLAEGCAVILAAGLGNADRLADDKERGLALLRVYGARNLSPLALTHETPKASELTLIGIPAPKEQEGHRKLTEVKARLTEAHAIELRQPVPMAGFSGAAALDAQGHFLGMREMDHAFLASIGPAPPPVRLITAKTIRDFLAAHDVTPAPTPAADAKASVVRIICVRK